MFLKKSLRVSMPVWLRPVTTLALIAALMILTVSNSLGAGSSNGPYDRTGVWWNRVSRPLFGMAYTAEPSDYNDSAPLGTPERNVCDKTYCKYFDSDFTNADFSMLWGPDGRNDLLTIKNMGLNFIALYDWSGGFCRNHQPFLAAATNDGLMVTIPISDFNLKDVDAQTNNIRSILFEAYGLDPQGNGTPNISPAASMWRLGNEAGLHNIPARNVVKAAKIIIDFENEENIPDNQKLLFTSDVDFGVYDGRPPGIAPLLKLKQAFVDAGMSDIWHTRFISSINTTNPGSEIKNYVENVFPKQDDFSEGQGLAMFLTEYGRNAIEACKYIRDTTSSKLDCHSLSDQNVGQDLYDKDEFQIGTSLATGASTSYFYGFAIFQWQDAFWKCPNEYKGYDKGTACTESTFGIQTVGSQSGTGNITGGVCGLSTTATYPVNILNPKPIFNDIPGTIR